MDPTQRRRLGRTPLEVTALGFGGAVVGNLYTTLAEDQALEAVDAAYQAGLRLFDIVASAGLPDISQPPDSERLALPSHS